MTRKNSATTLSPLMPGSRPPPPDCLRTDMKDEWRRVVGRMPAGWFPLETLPVLEQLCRVTCYARHLGAWLDKVDPTTLPKDEVRRFKVIAAQHGKWVNLMAMLAGKLRLTVSSQVDVRNSRARFGTDPHSVGKPWDLDEFEPNN